MISQTQNSHYLSEEQRAYIYSLHQQQYSYSSIREEFQKVYGKKIYDSTIMRICDKVETIGSVATLPKSGRPTKYDEREGRAIVRGALQDPFASSRTITDDDDINPKGASRSTISNILAMHIVSSRVLPKRMADLTSKHIKARMSFADDHLSWGINDWELVVFSDEADLFPTKCGREFVRIKEGQKLVDIAPIRAESKKLLTVKVWGAISSFGVGPLVKYEKTMKGPKYVGILNGHLVQEYPMLNGSRMEIEGEEDKLPQFSFVQDNATPHTSKITRDWLDENEVNLMRLPPNSPDINIIENVWAYLQDKLYDVRSELHSPDDTWTKAQEIWTNIPLMYIQNLYLDLPLRMKDLKRNKGGPI